MEFNRDLALKVRDTIKANPSLHDQEVWGKKLSCGTSHCLAGWTCTLSGVKLRWTETLSGYAANFTDDEREIPDVAAELLGLDQDQVDALFYEFNDGAALEMLEALIDSEHYLDYHDLLGIADEYRSSVSV